MKLAIIVPVPDLTRFGYGRIAAECIGSMARIADRVYLVSSTRNHNEACRVAAAQDNGYISSHEMTWFARTPEGDEWFDPYKVMENCNYGMMHAKDAGYDVAACLMCNQYIPDDGAFYLLCRRMLENNLAWAWVYRMDQLGDQLFHASVRVPFLVNLHMPALRWSTDSISRRSTILTTMQRGNYAEMDALSVVDVQLEVTREELADKQNYIRCYSDVLPKRRPTFEWPYWYPYYIDKFRKKHRAGTVTDPVGTAIAAKSEPEFVSQQVLGAL